MSKSQQKIVLSASRDIPFNRLVLSQANVRRIKAGISIEELAEDIARRTLLQSISVRPVLDKAGAETGMFEIPAGGRRYRALELLVKQKRLARTAPVPCVIRVDGIAEEDSLAENVQRAPLHPLDQFRAFQTLREKGQSEEEIAAAFFVSVSVVRQRLRLASVSPKLLEIYADDGMTLDQLMAFTVNPDAERQEEVFETMQRSYAREPHQIRRMLTEGAVRASDRRAQFVGLEAYAEAGGAAMRDLFQADDGGWLQDAALLDRLALEKLDDEASKLRSQGWKWVEAAISFPYGHNHGLRHVAGEKVVLAAEELATLEALKAEYDQLEETHAGVDELPEEVDERLAEIEAALESLTNRPAAYDKNVMAQAGCFVSIDGSGDMRIERGYVRPEDEQPVKGADSSEQLDVDDDEGVDGTEPTNGSPEAEPFEDEGIRPLPDRVVAELTVHRTLALRDAVANDPQIAFVSALHVLCLKQFYRYSLDTCFEIDARTTAFGTQAPALAETVSARAIDARHANWAGQLPSEAADLWDTLLEFDSDSREALFAHCVSQTLNAVHETYSRRPKAIAHADRVAERVNLDMAAVGWRPTAEVYLSRVTKGRILQAVREAKGEATAQSIDHLKKADMVARAETILNGSGWLPEPLRTAGNYNVTPTVNHDSSETVDAGMESAAIDGNSDMAPEGSGRDDIDAVFAAHSIAAE